MKEKNVWAWLTKAHRELTGLHMVRVETPFDDGYPDIEGWLKNWGGFVIELKNCFRPTRITSQLIDFKIRPKQITFLKTRARAGGSAWLLIRVSGRGPTTHYLVPGNSLHFLESANRMLCPITETRLAQFAVPTHFQNPHDAVIFMADNANMKKYEKKFEI